MKKLHIILLSVLFFILAIFALCFVLPSYINWEKHKGFVESFLSNYTGYETKIVGKLEMQIVPNPKFYAENIQVKGFAGNENLIEIEHMIAYKDLKEFLSLDFSVNELVVNRPTVNMHVAEDGNPNWEPLKIRNNSYYSRKIRSFVNKFPQFTKVSIENASVIYRDNTKNITHDISNIYINSKSVNSEIFINSNFAFNDEKYKMTNKFDLANLGSIRVDNTINSDIGEIHTQGVVKNYSSLSKFSFTGKTIISVNDINKLDLDKNSVFGKVKEHVDLNNLNIVSDLTYSKHKLTVPNFELKTDQNQMIGSIDWVKKDEINMSASLDIKKLKVKEFKELSSSNIESWMDSTLDFSFLNNLSIAAVVTCSECVYGQRTLTESTIRASLSNNNLIINQLSVNTENENNEGNLNLTAIASLNNPVGFEVKQEFKNFPIHEFSPKLIQDKIKVNFDGKMSLSSSGNTLKAMLANLGGSFGLILTDIELQKINLSNLEKMSKSFLTGKGKSSYNTKVDDIRVEGAIRDGVLRHSDIDFVIKEKAYTSKGKLDIANLTLNYRIAPAVIDKNNLGVVVKGKISKPEIISDKLTPRGVIDAYGRVISRDIVKQSDRSKIKTHFDYKDKPNLKKNVETFFFEDKG